MYLSGYTASQEQLNLGNSRLHVPGVTSNSSLDLKVTLRILTHLRTLQGGEFWVHL
jgi:hypothetical protein